MLRSGLDGNRIRDDCNSPPSVSRFGYIYVVLRFVSKEFIRSSSRVRLLEIYRLPPGTTIYSLSITIWNSVQKHLKRIFLEGG